MDTKITPSRRRELAAKLGINEQYLYQCLTARRDMDPAEAVRIEDATDKEITRYMLCQKRGHLIWPSATPKRKKGA